jgi:hypothetical protein
VIALDKGDVPALGEGAVARAASIDRLLRKARDARRVGDVAAGTQRIEELRLGRVAPAMAAAGDELRPFLAACARDRILRAGVRPSFPWS